MLSWTDFRPPGWLVDLYTLNTILLVALFRDEFFDPQVEGKLSTIGGFIMLLFVPVAGVWGLVQVSYEVIRHGFDYSVFYMSLGIAIVASVIFYAVNSALT